ncbi:replication protein P [Nitrincola alkalilacustris]|uniref:replication protein P n=1 Tax=Nitrincola alkalilacustris TaxID=1571224 RepID=UPI001F0F86B3|nr:replication protein P [Nitrincola alkalilacustris]
MKTPSEILATSENGLLQPSWTSRTPTGESAEQQSRPGNISVETKAHVNMIFARFMAIYGHKFKSCFETENEIRIAKREWALSLAGFSESELVLAVNRCKETLAWMPTISEFLAIIRDLNGDFGLPGLRRAYQEACLHADHPAQHRWSHPAVYCAGRETGWFQLRSEEESQTFPLFTYHYEIMCRRVRHGEDLRPPAPVALENKEDSTTALFIQQFAKDHELEDELACSLLYYMSKPRGTRIRDRLRAQSQIKADSLGLGITLPDEASVSST